MSPACWALVPAAGAGKRMGAEIPKQYLKLHGFSVLDHTLGRLLEHPHIEGVYLALSPDDAWWPDSGFYNDPRITRVGRVIRKLRIDELPQIWNVLKGDMSFVGPRPEREFFVKQLEEIIPFYRERFYAKPGITGWAQVSYGYGASVEDAIEKLNYDLFYIKNMSIFMDIVIIFKTVKIVLFGKGAR